MAETGGQSKEGMATAILLQYIAAPITVTVSLTCFVLLYVTYLLLIVVAAKVLMLVAWMLKLIGACICCIVIKLLFPLMIGVLPHLHLCMHNI